MKWICLLVLDLREALLPDTTQQSVAVSAALAQPFCELLMHLFELLSGLFYQTICMQVKLKCERLHTHAHTHPVSLDSLLVILIVQLS